MNRLNERSDAHLMPTEPNGTAAPPPLERHDRLTRVQFEQRYEAMPNLKKAEILKAGVTRSFSRADRRIVVIASAQNEKTAVGASGARAREARRKGNVPDG